MLEDTETNLDQETVEKTRIEIEYYAHLPKHIKGRVVELKDLKPNNEAIKPAHVVSGAITVISGKLNMPDLKHSLKFIKRTSF